MNELTKKYNRLVALADDALEKANKAIADEKFDEAKGFQSDADKHIEQANVIKAQIDKETSMADKNKSVEDEPIRAPFTKGKEPETPEGNQSYAQTVYFAKFGEPDKAVKQVITELWNSEGNYYDRRIAQNRAFSKYVRFGDSRMKADEVSLLRELIYTPDSIMSEVKAGVTMSDIKSLKATLQESALELGGHLVPEDLRLDIIKRMMGMTAVRGRARQINTVRDAVEYPVMQGGDSLYTSAVRVTWVNEVPTLGTEHLTNFTLGNVRIPVHTVMASTDISNNLLEDSGVDVIGLVTELFAEASAIDEDTKFLTGTGGDSPQGILGARTGAEYNPVAGIDSVNSGAAAALTADGLIDLVYEPDAQYLSNAIMLGTKATFKTVRKMKDGVGDYLWAKGIERGAPPTVLGYDYLMNENLPTIAANAYPLIFGDMRGYLIVDRVGMTVRRVEDRTSATRNFVTLVMRRRLGGQVVEPFRFAAQKVSA